MLIVCVYRRISTNLDNRISAPIAFFCIFLYESRCPGTFNFFARFDRCLVLLTNVFPYIIFVQV
ncbi:hypothetical protein CW304_06305 [Bacillus sp. UFRGS-B20]|nr:hypothetical protein CW304_06305 [Bacillus sp. UFRGS-B20]